MRVLSVNVGQPRANPSKPVALTGIDKRPVSGPVTVTAPGPKGTGEVGLAGDRCYNVKHHGGTDQAVYAYAREDLDAWAAELGRDLANGVFGENLTTEGIAVNDALIGERWRVGPGLLLEVSCPRIPCGTFQGWLERDGWIKRFTQAAALGDRGGYLPRADHGTGAAAVPAGRGRAAGRHPGPGPQAGGRLITGRSRVITMNPWQQRASPSTSPPRPGGCGRRFPT
jgi:MOSC domain-containing protein YiiM